MAMVPDFCPRSMRRVSWQRALPSYEPSEQLPSKLPGHTRASEPHSAETGLFWCCWAGQMQSRFIH